MPGNKPCRWARAYRTHLAFREMPVPEVLGHHVAQQLGVTQDSLAAGFARASYPKSGRTRSVSRTQSLVTRAFSFAFTYED